MEETSTLSTNTGGAGEKLDSLLNLSSCSQAKGDFILGAHLETIMPFWLSSLGMAVVLLVEGRNAAKYSTMYKSPAVTKNQQCQC